ncbi:MAG: hypothetical protein ACRC4W_04730 [Treponemataceae bacterium]
MSLLTKYALEDPNAMKNLTIDLKEKLIEGATATVNIQAAIARKNAIQSVKTKFTNRNSFTSRQVQYDKQQAGRYNLDKIQSKVGITEKAGYMELHETGGTKTNDGKQINIATDVARGGNRSSMVKQKNYLNKLSGRTLKGSFAKKVKSKKARTIARAAIAAKEKLVMNFRKSLFEISNFKKLKSGKVSFKKKMIFNRKFTQVKIEKKPFFHEACKEPAEDGQAIFNKQMDKIMKR